MGLIYVRVHALLRKGCVLSNIPLSLGKEALLSHYSAAAIRHCAPNQLCGVFALFGFVFYGQANRLYAIVDVVLADSLVASVSCLSLAVAYLCVGRGHSEISHLHGGADRGVGSAPDCAQLSCQASLN